MTGRKRKAALKLLLYIMVIAVYVIVIYLFSNQTGSESNSISKDILKSIGRLVRSVTGKDFFSNAGLESVNYIFRKLIHFSEYCILAVLLYKLFQLSGFLLRTRLLLTIGFAFLYASLDEFHQVFIPGRTSRVFDVCIDTSGALLGAIIMYFIEKGAKSGHPGA